MNKIIYLHPFLFSLFPVFSLWAQNIDELSFTRSIFLMSLAILFTGIVFLIFRLIFTTWNKAAVVSTTAMLLFFSFGHFYNAIFSSSIVFLRYSHLLFIWAVLFVLAAYLVWRTQNDLRTINKGLSVASVILIAVPIFSVVIPVFSDIPVYDEPTNLGKKELPLFTSENKELPDVYYIILDQYASNWTLKRFYNYDNSAFTNFLKDLGFFVDDKSITNYSVTAFTLRSALNMDYLENLSPPDPNEQIKNHLVGRLFKEFGYQYIHFGSEWEITAQNPYAHRNINKNSLSESLKTIYSQTMLYPVAYATGLDAWLTRKTQRNRILYQLNELEKIPRIQDPTFTFVHLGVPHAPFVFNRDGSLNKSDSVAPEGWIHDPDIYLNQLIFTSEKIKTIMEKIIKESEAPPIIILQSDHGAKTFSLEGIRSVDAMSDVALQNHFRNFSAYYLPEGGRQTLYEGITTVNIFRSVFNHYFKGSFPILPDISFMSINEGEKEFVDVTRRVAY